MCRCVCVRVSAGVRVSARWFERAPQGVCLEWESVPRQQAEAVEFCPEYGRGLLTVQLVQLGRADLRLRSVVPNHLHVCVCVCVSV